MLDPTSRRRVTARALLVAPLCIFLAACETTFKGQPERLPQLDQDIDQILALYSPEEVSSFLKAAPGSLTVARRNAIVDARMFAVDRRYNVFEMELLAEGRRSNFATSLVDLGVDIAGAFASGGASRGLSAISAGVTGLSSAFNSEILVEKTLSALTSQMRANRSLIKARIQGKLNQSVSKYSLIQALSDVEEYYYAGTLAGALLRLTQESSKAEAEAREVERVASASRISFTLDDPAEKIRGVIFTDEAGTTLDPGGVARVKECWRQLGIDAGTFITDFILQPKFEDDRKRVAGCLDS